MADRSKNASETEVRAAQLMTPELANLVGNIHGGHIVRIADDLAYACASRYAGTGCTTAAMDRVDLYEPVHVGELLHLVARVTYVGHASMEVEVEVAAEDLESGSRRQTNACHFTLVALKDGRPFPVPRLVCRTKEEKARYLRAKTRREMGLRYREDRNGRLAQFDDLDEQSLDRLIAEESRRA